MTINPPTAQPLHLAAPQLRHLLVEGEVCAEQQEPEQAPLSGAEPLKGAAPLGTLPHPLVCCCQL